MPIKLFLKITLMYFTLYHCCISTWKFSSCALCRYLLFYLHFLLSPSSWLNASIRKVF